MGQISFDRPADGTSNWAPVADQLLDALKAESNDQDNRLSNVEQALGRVTTTINTGGSNAAITDAQVLDVKAYGARGDGVADDTAAVQAAIDDANGGTLGTRTVYFPAGVYPVSAPIRFYTGTSIVGQGWSPDSTYQFPSMIKASNAFVGTDILTLDPGNGVVPAPGGGGGTIPDLSWHWGVIERIHIRGNGTSGPRGLNPGWFGEASAIKNVMVTNAKAGFYLTGPQASAQFEGVSVFNNGIGVHLDDISSTVAFFGLSGDDNTTFLKIKGGVSTNVTITKLKTEAYAAGTADPLILLEDLTGGALTIVGGWADTNAARSDLIKITQPGGSTIRPQLTLINFHANSLWTNYINDTFDNRTVAGIGALRHRAVFYNTQVQVFGDRDLQIGYGRSIQGTDYDNATSFPMLTAGSDDSTIVTAGDVGGGRLMAYNQAADLVRWGKSGGNNLGFFGANPIIQPAVLPPDASDLASAIKLLNYIKNFVLIPLGLAAVPQPVISATFDTDTQNFVALSGATIARVTTPVDSGAGALQVTATATLGSGASSPTVPVIAGVPYTFTARVNAPVTITAEVGWLDSTHTYISGHSLYPGAVAGYQTVTDTVTAPANAAYAFWKFDGIGTATTFYVDSVQVIATP